MIIVCLLVNAVSAYSQQQVSISRIEGEIKFDGNIDDACWQNMNPLAMVMHTPTFGNQPTEKSEVMICYDNTYLYIGARLYDSNPVICLFHQKNVMNRRCKAKS